MSDNNCLFCKIVAGSIPSKKVFESDEVCGFVDITPQAKVHLLFIHKNHRPDIMETMKSPEELVATFTAIATYCKQEGLDQEGFRIVNNCGEMAGQTVLHTHFHVLSGEGLGKIC